MWEGKLVIITLIPQRQVFKVTCGHLGPSCVLSPAFWDNSHKADRSALAESTLAIAFVPLRDGRGVGEQRKEWTNTKTSKDSASLVLLTAVHSSVPSGVPKHRCQSWSRTYQMNPLSEVTGGGGAQIPKSKNPQTLQVRSYSSSSPIPLQYPNLLCRVWSL